MYCIVSYCLVLLTLMFVHLNKSKSIKLLKGGEMAKDKLTGTPNRQSRQHRAGCFYA